MKVLVQRSASLRTSVRFSGLLGWLVIAIGMPLGWAVLGQDRSGATLVWMAGLSTLLVSVISLGLQRSMRNLIEQLLGEQKTENRRFHTAIDHISQGLCFFDGKQRLIVCNRRYAEMYGLSLEQIPPGTTLREIVDRRYLAGSVPEMSRDAYLAWRDSISVSDTASDTVIALRDGRSLAIHHQPMPDGGWVSTHDDITEQRRAVAQIERMAHHDELTGLPNRVRFRERLNESIGLGSTSQPVALLCIDLDRFKAVNDTLGHPIGDELLRIVALRLGECVRQTDLVARLGGDEFAVIQIGAPQPAAARSLAERLVQAMALPFVIGGQQVLVGTSVGIALSPDDGIDPDELLKRADLALYDAKAAGRGTYSLFRPLMGEQAQSRRRLEIDLRCAADNGELELHYQPIVAVNAGPGDGARKVVGFEALLRWRHPLHGMVMPDTFIPLAEETGLIESIGEWVLNRAFDAALCWPAHVGVAVNLSPLQLKSGNLVRIVTAALQRTGLAPRRVDLEITESVALAENSINVAILHELRGLGVRISLDDFGVGFSSLSYLRSFPFGKIKIDRSFTRDVVGSRHVAAIVKAMTTLSKSLDMVITAEGVETEAQLDCLRELGVDEAQGYLMGPARPARDVEALLRPDRHLTLVGAVLPLVSAAR